jgi:hypothetical protein
VVALAARRATRNGHGLIFGTTMHAIARTLVVGALSVVGAASHAQNLYYADPGLASCRPVPAPTTAAPKVVVRGVAVPGRIHVGCGFDQGSYTVSLNATDPAATFAPKTFIVNFGRVVGNGTFAVTFSTPGVQRVTATITSNMGSPAVQGRFVGPDSRFNVVNP